MRISIFGMGYVGIVCAALFARRGCSVVGVDVSEDKVDAINAGQAPIVEPGLPELLAEVVGSGRLRATRSVEDAIDSSEISFVCVGTPSRGNGDLDLSHVVTVCREIGAALRDRPNPHLIVIRSTVLPGTMRSLVIPALEEASGKRAGEGLQVAVNPEFLRECTAIRDFDNPPFTIIGADDEATAARVAALYEGVEAELVIRKPEVAEMIKYTCNAWHATKVAFANEIGAIAKQFGVDGRNVMDVACKDKVLNISSYYMCPGFSFGGSCLPKDVRALIYRAGQADMILPLLKSLLPSNRAHLDRGLDLVMAHGKRKVGMLGLSFKFGTDDLRESPFVELAEKLIGKGYDLRIHDRHVDHARMHGANRDYINNKIPHLAALLTPTVDEVINHSEVIVVCYRDPEFDEPLIRRAGDRKVIDLAGLALATVTGDYEGICW